jgi:predicted MPP superfamily phosphohydrolase
MIVRYIVFFLLIILLPVIYEEWHFGKKAKWWWRFEWWAATFIMLVLTVWLAIEPNFAPDNLALLYTYLLLIGLLGIPKVVFCTCSLIGLLLKPYTHHRNYGNLVGSALVGIIWFIGIWGITKGTSEMTVRYETITFKDLPAAFDGYKIVQFSDTHVGTYDSHHQQYLQRAIDSINAQHPDLIAFTGDLQNMRPSEIYPHVGILSTLRSRDGVYAVLGNHDYAVYTSDDEATKKQHCLETQALERKMGWTLLLNEHRTIRWGKDSIIIAGMQNSGTSKRAPKLGDIKKTMAGVKTNTFAILMQHDPSTWEDSIMPKTHAQLTLSGHTHGGQFEIFGWSPVAFQYKEWGGLYQRDGKYINVSTGLGGFVPFRFGIPGEIVVITLKRK